MKGFILTYLLAFGGAAAALFNPFVGVLVYWIFDIVRPQYMFAWSGVEGPFSLVIALATIIGWAIKGFGNWQFGRGRLIVGFFLAHCLWTTLSALSAPDQDVAIAFLIVQTKRVIMFMLAVTLADSLARVKALAWTVVGAAGYLSLELNLKYFAGFNEVQALGYGGMDNNSMAITLVTCLGPAVFLGLYAHRMWQKGLAFAAAALIGHTVLLTFSRGGLFALIVCGVVAILVIPKRPSYLALMTVALLIALRLAGPELRDRFGTAFAAEEERDFSAQSRLTLWMNCVEVMRKYPLLGAGPDHFPLIADEFGWPRGKEAHSLWLQVGAETGVPGLLSLALFYAATIWRLFRLLRSRAETLAGDWAPYAGCMVVTSLVAFCVGAQFVTMEGLEVPLYVAVIGIGTLRMATAVAKRDDMVLEPGPPAEPAHAGWVDWLPEAHAGRRGMGR
jgi:probable O-glycosylation ligase (exosortase A-associated)